MGRKNLPRADFPSRRGSIMFRQFVREGFFVDIPAHGVLINDKKGEGRYGGDTPATRVAGVGDSGWKPLRPNRGSNGEQEGEWDADNSY